MSLQTSIFVNGLLASTGLLVGGGAVAGMTATYQYSESGFVFHYADFQPVTDIGRFSSTDGLLSSKEAVGHFNNAYIARAIAVFNYGVAEKLVPMDAKSLQGAQINWWWGDWDRRDGTKHSGRFERHHAGTSQPTTSSSSLPDTQPTTGSGQATSPIGSAQPTTSVPEPATLSLLGLGLAGIGFAKRGNRRDRK